MQLSNAINQVIRQFGRKALPTPGFVNIVADLGGFRDTPPASKKVMRGLLESGFGELLYRLSGERPDNWQNLVKKCVGDYTVTSGYKEELISGIATRLLYGIGLMDELPASVLAVPSAGAKADERADERIALLQTLKDKYVEALSDLLTITTDEFGHRYGYYSTEANARLYAIACKIRLVAKEAKVTNVKSWMAEERRKVETRNRPTPIQITQALDDLRATLEGEYTAMMEKGVVVDTDEFGMKSAGFSEDALPGLQEIENKILIIGNKSNDDRQPWIDKTKSDFLVSKSSTITARKNLLEQLKNEYVARLIQLDRHAPAEGIDFKDEPLKELRRKVVKLGESLGRTNMERWCDVENSKIAGQRLERIVKRNWRRAILGAVAVVVLSIVGFYAILYVSSADERKYFETAMASADAEFNKGNHAVALTLFQRAGNSYGAPCYAIKYKAQAKAKAIEATDSIIAGWERSMRPLLAAGDLTEAKSLTQALPDNLVFAGDFGFTYRKLKKELDTALEKDTTTAAKNTSDAGNIVPLFIRTGNRRRLTPPR